MKKSPFKNLSYSKKWSFKQVESYFRQYLSTDIPSNVIDSIISEHYQDAVDFVNVAARIEFLLYWYGISLNG